MVKKIILAATMGLGLLYWAAPSDRVTAQGYSDPHRDEPSAFRSRSSSLKNLTISHVYSIKREDAWIDTPWPFPTDWVLVACAQPAMTVVKVGDRYAALNGNTSSAADSYDIVERSGRTERIMDAQAVHTLASHTANDSSKAASYVREWRAQMNTFLLKYCGR